MSIATREIDLDEMFGFERMPVDSMHWGERAVDGGWEQTFRSNSRFFMRVVGEGNPEVGQMPSDAVVGEGTGWTEIGINEYVERSPLTYGRTPFSITPVGEDGLYLLGDAFTYAR